MPKKQTFLDEPTTENNIKHLRIVITDANKDSEFLTVPVDTLRSEYQDKSCIINVGDHSFIKHKSFVNYKFAAVLTFQQIFNGLHQGLLISKEDVTEEVLKRIQEGAKKSPNLDNKYKIWFDLF